MKPLSLSAYSLRRNSASRVIARLRESRSLRTNLPLAILVASLATIFAVRYVLVRQHLDMGPDIANYLTTMNTLFGHDVTGAGLLRPPLIAIPLKLFTVVFGDLTGVKLLGVFISVAIGLPFYLIAKRISPPWIAVAVTILFVLTPAYANVLTWGYITMAGLFFTLLALYFFLLILESPSTQNILLAGLSSSLVVGLHQLSAAFLIPLLFSLITALVLLRRDQARRSLVPLSAAAAVAVLLSIPYAPIYLRMLRLQSTGPDEASAPATTAPGFAAGLEGLPWLWAIMAGVAVALGAVVWLWHRDKNTSILLGVLLVFPLALMLFTLPQPFTELNRRAHYLIYVPIWATAGLALSQLWAWRTSGASRLRYRFPRLATAGIISSLLISSVILSQREVSRGSDFYGYLDDARWDAVQWVKSNTPGEATIAVYPADLEWWIEGEAQRGTIGVVDRNTEPYRFEREASLTADRMLSGNQGIENRSIRLSTCYPYQRLEFISAYLGGTYHHLSMLDSSQTYILTEGQTALPISDASNQESVTYGDSNSMQIVTSCQIAGATITETARLEDGSQTAVVNYALKGHGTAVTHIDIPVFFCHEAKSVVRLDTNRLQIVQQVNTPSEGMAAVTTELTFEGEAATLDALDIQSDAIRVSFQIQGQEASITLGFSISTVKPMSPGQVVQYEVPQLIKDCSADYLAIDMEPDSVHWNNLPDGVQRWLDSCPYYKLVYPPEGEGDIRIYEVLASALP
jgi:hypothetical protein